MTWKTLLGCPNGSVHGTGLLLELDELELDELLELGELLLELDGRLLELDGILLVLESEELEKLLRDELLLEGTELLLDGGDGVLLCELRLLNELADGDELLDLDNDELLEGGRYPLLELDELDDDSPVHGGGGAGPQGGAQGGAQLGGYGGNGG